MDRRKKEDVVVDDAPKKKKKKNVVINNALKIYTVNCANGIKVDLKPGRNSKLTDEEFEALTGTDYFDDLVSADVLEVK